VKIKELEFFRKNHKNPVFLRATLYIIFFFIIVHIGKISTGKIFIWQKMKSLSDESTGKTHMQKFSAHSGGIFEKSTSRIRTRGLQLVSSALDH
jgi:hypothetical protein